jgi:hypothetical protein
MLARKERRLPRDADRETQARDPGKTSAAPT